MNFSELNGFGNIPENVITLGFREGNAFLPQTMVSGKVSPGAAQPARSKIRAAM
jgi:hypothetical protein